MICTHILDAQIRFDGARGASVHAPRVTLCKDVVLQGEWAESSIINYVQSIAKRKKLNGSTLSISYGYETEDGNFIDYYITKLLETAK